MHHRKVWPSRAWPTLCVRMCVLGGGSKGQALEKTYDGVGNGNIKIPKEENCTQNGKD